MIPIVLKKTNKGKTRAYRVERYSTLRPLKLDLAESMILDGKAYILPEKLVLKAWRG